MDLLNNISGKIKPIFHTFLFEISLSIKKFIIFSIIVIFQLFLFNYIRFINGSMLSGRLDLFYIDGTNLFVQIIILAVCFFFSGIICSEYKDKTGLIIMPLINKYKLLIGKYLANLCLVIGIAVIHYSFLILLGYNFYGEPIINTWILSFGFCVLYIFALSSIVTFVSAFMPSPVPVIVLVGGLAVIGFEFIDLFVMRMLYDFEPLYSLTYLSKIIPNILDLDFFTTKRYVEEGFPKVLYKQWYVPSVEGALTMLLLYGIIFFILAILIFKRKEL